MKSIKHAFAVAVVAGVAIGITEEAFAADAKVYNVEDVYKTVTHQIPHTQKVCETTKVPIYGEESFDQDKAIIGGIIGGVIGNQIGKGGGKEAATGVGAIAGAIIGGKGDKRITGYQNVTQCHNETTYTSETKRVYNYSVINFDYDGLRYSLTFKKQN